MDKEFSGKRVIIRGHGNALYVRALLAFEGRVAVVCKLEDRETITRDVNGRMEVPIFGFPLEDVFEWTDKLAQSKRPWEEAPSLAQRLEPERREHYIRGARRRRNRPRPTE